MGAGTEMSFRQRLRRGEPLVGTMLKTAACQHTEILGNIGFDLVVVDQEHSPFDRGTTDLVLLAGRAARIPVLVRVPNADLLLGACDGGAEGVIIPHVSDPDYARRVAAACRYRGGSRGYATSTRAGGYTSVPMAEHIRTSDATVAVIVQIEDPDGVREADSIVRTDGIDAVFIGRNDLACSLGVDSLDAPPVREAVARIAASAQSAQKPLGVFVSGAGEIETLKELGATLFIFSSDHGFLRSGAARALAEARAKLDS